MFGVFHRSQYLPLLVVPKCNILKLMQIETEVLIQLISITHLLLPVLHLHCSEVSFKSIFLCSTHSYFYEFKLNKIFTKFVQIQFWL
jgi:hypothetical protein